MKKFPLILSKIVLLSIFALTLASTIVLANTSKAAASPNTGSTVTASANNNVLVSTMCRALQLVTGNAGKAFAAFAIISLGIGFFTGKVSWGLMIGVAMGIAAMFGAPTIVAALTGGNAFDCSAS